MTRWLASAVAGTAAWVAGLVAFFGPAQLLLANPDLQHPKMLAAFTDAPPPRMVDAPWILPVGLFVVNLAVAGAYRLLRPALAGSLGARGRKFGAIAWLVAIPWFEFYLPFNVLREPFALVLLEGACWFLTLQLVGHAVAWADGWRRSGPSEDSLEAAASRGRASGSERTEPR